MHLGSLESTQEARVALGYRMNKFLIVLQKDALQNTEFSRLKCQLKRRKIDSPSL